VKGGQETIPFDGRIVRKNKDGKQVIIPVKIGQKFQMQPGDQFQYPMVTDYGKQKQLTPQQQRNEAIKKMPDGEKLIEAAKMVPDLLKGDAKAAFKSLTTDPLFVAQLVGVSAAFAIAQATPAGPFIDAALAAVIGISGGISLAKYLFKAHGAVDDIGLKASAEELKNLVEIVGLAALSGALRMAGKVLGRIKGSVTAEQAARKVLFDEMTKAGIKFTPENILKIARGQDGKIVFLEKGKETIKAAEGVKEVRGAGLAHIMEKSQNFVDRRIPKNQIADAVFDAVTKGKKLGPQGNGRDVYKVVINGETQYISVSVGSNGFIVGANPTPERIIQRLTQGKK
jgi:hypothetical protein